MWFSMRGRGKRFSFNSPYWVPMNVCVECAEKLRDFQFPLLGSYSDLTLNQWNRSLSIPLIGFKALIGLEREEETKIFQFPLLGSLWYSPHYCQSSQSCFQFPLLGSGVATITSMTWSMALSIPLIGFKITVTELKPRKVEAFNSPYWVHIAKCKNNILTLYRFQFPLLGSKRTMGHKTLFQSRPFNSPYWVPFGFTIIHDCGRTFNSPYWVLDTYQIIDLFEVDATFNSPYWVQQESLKGGWEESPFFQFPLLGS